MANYVSNTRISGPSNLGDVQADVDFNGLQWSYKFGLMFPPASNFQTVPWIMPSTAAATYVPGTPAQ